MMNKRVLQKQGAIRTNGVFFTITTAAVLTAIIILSQIPSYAINENNSAKNNLGKTHVQQNNTNNAVIRLKTIELLFEALEGDEYLEIDSKTGDIVLGADILFGSNSKVLSFENKLLLNSLMPRVLSVLMNADVKEHVSKVIIEGHSDDIGCHPNKAQGYLYNVKLSLDRAYAVADYLMNTENEVLPEDAISYLQSKLNVTGKAFSELKYEDLEQTIVNRTGSRRVEIKIRLSDESMTEQSVQVLEKQAV